MKSAITIKKENYASLNAYTVIGSNGSRLYRTKNKYEYKEVSCVKNEYAVLGMINGNPVFIECRDYRSAKQLFTAMQ